MGSNYHLVREKALKDLNKVCDDIVIERARDSVLGKNPNTSINNMT